MESFEQFKKHHSGKILNHLLTKLKLNNPFPRNAVCTKDNLPDFCIGRDEELGLIQNTIENVVNDIHHKSAWIPISGSGGVGKSTLAFYIYRQNKEGKLSEINLEKMESAYVECTATTGSLTLSYIYKHIYQDLGGNGYTYQLAGLFFKKFYVYLKTHADLSQDFIEKFGRISSQISQANNFTNIKKTIDGESKKFIHNLIQFIHENDYYFEEDKRIIALDLIINLLHCFGNYSDRNKSLKYFRGDEIQDTNDAISMLHSLITIQTFIHKKSCLLIILDNMENLPQTDDRFRRLFQILILFRNQINHSVFITIGSLDFWSQFYDVLNDSEQQMVLGFKNQEINLSNVSEVDAAKILKTFLRYFWDQDSLYRPDGAYYYFPFSESSLKYIYEMNDRNLRMTIKFLFNLIERMKRKSDFKYFKTIEDAIFFLRPDNTGIYLYSNEEAYLEDQLDNYSNRNQLSRDIEQGLTQAFQSLKSNPEGRLIKMVQHEPSISLSDKKICPDILVTIQRPNSFDPPKLIEYQVKAYYPSNNVKYSEVENRIQALTEQKISVLNFITFSDLEDKAYDALSHFSYRVDKISKLSTEQQKYVFLLTKDMAKLFFKTFPLSTERYLKIFKKLDINILEDFNKYLEIQIKTPQPDIDTNEPLETLKTKIKRPKSPTEKFSNPKKLEPLIVEFIKANQPVSKKDTIIKAILLHASSKNAIENAISSLKDQSKLKYSRSSPKGWSLLI